MLDDRLRTSAAHVLVDDVAAPGLGKGAAHHLRVLRVRSGEVVTVTDGAGRWRPCRFERGALHPAGEVERVTAAQSPLAVAVAPPKGDRLDWLVAKCTEIGIDKIVFLDAERSVVRWTPERAGKQLDRLRRIAAEAAMQSRRVWLPSVDGPVKAIEVLAAAVVAEPGGRPLGPADHTIAIGPEGGWSPIELDHTLDTVSLGDTVLRVETAAVAAAVLMTRYRA